MFQAILKLLWDNAHLNNLPKHLIERALSEQLAILTDMTYNKDPNRRQYVLHCVDEIKAKRDCILPSVRHLHSICKSFSKSSASSYQKADKQTLGDLNRQHEIVKLLSMSLKHCHNTAVQVTERTGCVLKPDTLINDGYSHSAYVDGHLDLMKFFLKEGDLYLSWPRCRELWETLVENPKAIDFDKDNCFEWFQKCLTDLEAETQQMFFEQKLLMLSPSEVSHHSFNCFKAYFESINLSIGHLRKNISPSLLVEHLELIGLDYLWNLVTECPKDNIADDAIDYLLNMSFLHVSPKLKKDAEILHKKFINSCFTRLQSVNNGTHPAMGKQQDAAVQEGCELETSITKDPTACDTDEGSPRTLTSISISKASALPINSKGIRMQKIRRLLLLAERYVSTIEETHPAKRTILPHAASFHGRAIKIQIVSEGSKKEDFSINSHTNELVGEVKKRVAEHKKRSTDQITLYHGDVLLCGNKERCLVGMIGPLEGQTWTCKSQDSVTTSLSSSSTALVVYQGASEKSAPTGDTSLLDNTKSRLSYLEEQEKSLPGVVMATENEGYLFKLFYSLGSLEDSLTVRQLRRLIHLIPTDDQAVESLQIIRYYSTPGNDRPLASASPSPKLSPRNKKIAPSGRASLEEAKIQLAKLFDAGSENMSPFRVLYNLEVLSAKLMPTNITEISQQFCQDFLECGGLRHILNVFEKESLPVDTDYDIRQSIYLVTLQLGAFLLCGQTPLGPSKYYESSKCIMNSSPATASEPSSGGTSSTVSTLQHSSPIMKPTPPKKSALDSSLIKKEQLELPVVMTPLDGVRSPIAICASKIVSTMLDSEFSDTVSCLMRVAWSAAAGNLKLASSTLGSAHADQQSTRFFATRRSRDSSTGSSGSTGSDPGNAQLSDTLHAGVCAQQQVVSCGDAQIAGEALDFLVKCLQLRNHNISCFYNLPLVNDFIIDTLLGSPSKEVRQSSCEQFVKLSKIRITNRNLSFELSDFVSSNASSSKYLSPKQFLTKALLKTPVPLWMPSCKARGISHSILAQCTEYFELRCFLLKNLSKQEQDLLGENAHQMMEDELTFLNNFTLCHRLHIDCILIAGHLRLMEALVTCDGIDKTVVGATLIPEILNVYLFPSSRYVY